VIAITGRTEEEDYLKSLGASEIVDRAELSGPPKPLAKERWIGAVDAAGGNTLANLLASTKYGGTVAACGLAGGADLPSTVMPFILRGVTLAGIDSVMAPRERRIAAYERLVTDLDRDTLTAISSGIGFDDIIDCASEILAGQVRGRLVVNMTR